MSPISGMAIAALESTDDGTTREASAKDHRFQPAEFEAAAGTPIVFEVKILHPQPAAFDSSTFHASI
jgi:plastocyanin